MLSKSQKIFIKNILFSVFGYIGIPYNFFPKKLQAQYVGALIFKKRSVICISDGVYAVDPMPEKYELDLYYRSLYWNSRQDVVSIRMRDIEHFYILQELFNGFGDNQISFLNFGAGHGGVSNILKYNRSITVCDVDPSFNNESLGVNHQTYESINTVQERVDVFYSSHSLEHVLDIDEFWHDVRAVLHKDSLVFIEVPNSLLDSNGGVNGEIIIPHTYYFTPDYFNNVEGFKLQYFVDPSYFYGEQNGMVGGCDVIRVVLKRDG